jgi:hypothetical protein
MEKAFIARLCAFFGFRAFGRLFAALLLLPTELRAIRGGILGCCCGEDA